MAKRLSRKELYELVWSEPMRILARRSGISDVALKKACARAEIPTPGLGHWARKAARKSASQVALGDRPPGIDEEVLVGAGVGYWHSGWREEELSLEQEGSRFGFERRALRDGLVDANDQSGRAVQGLG